MIGRIYAIHNDKNDMVYIGSTTKELSSVKLRGVPGLVESKLLADVRHFGADHFYVELLEETTVDNLRSRHREIVSSYDPSKLYNVQTTPVNYEKLNQIIEKHKDDLRSVDWTINKE